MGTTIVIGGGVIGLSAAWHLAQRGESVTVLEADATLGDSASCGNAGLIALGHAPMPAPKLIGRTMKMLFDPLNPLYVRPRLSIELVRWFLEFRRACSPRVFERSMRVLGELGHAVPDSFEEIINAEGMECEYGGEGWLDVYRTPEGRSRAHTTAQLERDQGFQIDIIEGDVFHQRWPAFNDGVLGGALRTESRTAWPDAFIRELAAAVQRRGVSLRLNARVDRLLTSKGSVYGAETTAGTRFEADRVFLCAGMWSTQIARTIDLHIPMQAGKGYHLSVENPGLNVGSVLSETYVAATPMGGRLRLAGTVEFSGINRVLRRKRLDMLLKGADLYLQGINPQTRADEWCGLRPCTADGLPVIGEAPGVSGLWIGTGHAMMGFTLGPLTGKLLAQMSLNEHMDVDVSPYQPARFEKRKRQVS